MSVQQRRKYDPDFKRNAVLLSEEPGKAVTEIAD
nr:transposase [Desulfomarina profundi]